MAYAASRESLLLKVPASPLSRDVQRCRATIRLGMISSMARTGRTNLRACGFRANFRSCSCCHCTRALAMRRPGWTRSAFSTWRGYCTSRQKCTPIPVGWKEADFHRVPCGTKPSDLNYQARLDQTLDGRSTAAARDGRLWGGRAAYKIVGLLKAQR